MRGPIQRPTGSPSGQEHLLFSSCASHDAEVTGELLPEEFSTWSMEKMLEAFHKDLDLREDDLYAVNLLKIRKENRLKGGTANTLHTKQDNVNCAFCLGKHAHEKCHRIKDTKECKSILIKFGRCFRHRARECGANVTCSNCRQHSHHVSLCESKDKQLSPNARKFEVFPEQEDAKPS